VPCLARAMGLKSPLLVTAAFSLETEELDAVFICPMRRLPHPSMQSFKIPAYEHDQNQSTLCSEFVLVAVLFVLFTEHERVIQSRLRSIFAKDKFGGQGPFLPAFLDGRANRLKML